MSGGRGALAALLTLTSIACAWFAQPAHAVYEVTDSFGKHYFEAPPERVVVTDWAVLEQLLELGITPIGAPELDAYRRYSHHTDLPDDIVDIGLRLAPDIETLRELQPDLIILGTGQKELARPYSRFARVMYYQSFSDKYRGNGEKSRVRFLQMAELFAVRRIAEQKLEEMDQCIVQLRSQLDEHFAGAPPVVTQVRFSSPDKVLIYGTNSLPFYAQELLGLTTDYPLPRSRWGEREERIDELANIDDGLLIYFQPAEPMAEISQGVQWRALPAVADQRVHSIEPVWSYGGAMSVGHIARHLTRSLTGSDPVC